MSFHYHITGRVCARTTLPNYACIKVLLFPLLPLLLSTISTAILHVYKRCIHLLHEIEQLDNNTKHLVDFLQFWGTTV